MACFNLVRDNKEVIFITKLAQQYSMKSSTSEFGLQKRAVERNWWKD